MATKTEDLKTTAASRMSKIIGLKTCMCGPGRSPQRVVRDGISYLVCNECGGRTTPLKDR